jgi:hypothetical protein
MAQPASIASARFSGTLAIEQAKFALTELASGCAVFPRSRVEPRRDGLESRVMVMPMSSCSRPYIL